MRTICSIHHIACETLGMIAVALKRDNIDVQSVRTFQGQMVPKDIDQYDGLIVMGGPMGVHEQNRHPHLRDEIRLIEQALWADKPILGVCLGSQLLAAALGAQVYPGPRKEIGWFPITLSEAAVQDPLWTGIPHQFTALNWHGDVFDLPVGAVSLASSQLTEHQAFRFGTNACGILFHMEATPPMIGDWVATFADELQEADVDGSAIIAAAPEHLPALDKIGGLFFHRWARRVRGE